MIPKRDLVDAPERRSVAATEFELRVAGVNNVRLTGYASVFNRGYEVGGGPDGGGWTEIVTRSAFDRTLADNPHVHLLINHEGLPIASTKSGTLRLSADSTGLMTEATLDRRDPDVQGLAVKMERGDVDEMSFAFRVKRQRWQGDREEVRYLDEVSLHKGDVSIVSFGANPYTSAALRSAVRALARGDLDARVAAELRALLAAPRRAFGDGGLDAGDVFDDSDGQQDSTLAQAVHDLCRDAGANCSPLSLVSDAGDMYSHSARRGNLSVAVARSITGGSLKRARLTLAEARQVVKLS